MLWKTPAYILQTPYFGTPYEIKLYTQEWGKESELLPPFISLFLSKEFLVNAQNLAQITPNIVDKAIN